VLFCFRVITAIAIGSKPIARLRNWIVITLYGKTVSAVILKCQPAHGPEEPCITSKDIPYWLTRFF
jgi:hypothetical protein